MSLIHAIVHALTITGSMTWAITWALILGFGHPLAAKIWGPLIGPVVAIVSFVCSIGNVVLAAVLIIRFARTGGLAMLRMMGGSPDSHEHDHMDA